MRGPPECSLCLERVMSATRDPKSSAERTESTRRFAHATTAFPPAESRPLRFYDTDASLARIVAEFLVEGFNTGSPAVVIATASQRAEIARELTARSFDAAALQRSGDLVLLDAGETLSTVMGDGKLDAQKFRNEICRQIDRVRCGRPNCPVRIFGQMVDVLWRNGDREAAIRLELLWNQLAQNEASPLICGYAIGNFVKDARFEDLCDGQSADVADRSADRAITAASDMNRRRSKRKESR
jgi:hypothetical protein